jgi:hypothetical protein
MLVIQMGLRAGHDHALGFRIVQSAKQARGCLGLVGLLTDRTSLTSFETFSPDRRSRASCACGQVLSESLMAFEEVEKIRGNAGDTIPPRRGKRKKVGGALVRIKDDGAATLRNSILIVAAELAVCLRRPFCPKACRSDVRSLSAMSRVSPTPWLAVP